MKNAKRKRRVIGILSAIIFVCCFKLVLKSMTRKQISRPNFTNVQNVSLLWQTLNYFTNVSFLLVEFENSNYSLRYPNHIQSDNNWYYYIEKNVSNIGGDCGLYCEEDQSCDFFVPHKTFCFLGTFRKDRKDVRGLDLRMNGLTVYFVFKNDIRQFSIIEDLYAEVDYQSSLSISFIAEKLLYNSYNLTHIEFCPLMCKFSDRFLKTCHFWIASEAKDYNCFVGTFDASWSHKNNPGYNLSSDSNRHVNVINHTKYINLNVTKTVLQAYGLYDYSGSKVKGDYGNCNGSGVHIANSSTTWSIDLTLDYTYWTRCTFIIIRLFNGKMRISIPNFKVISNL